MKKTKNSAIKTHRKGLYVTVDLDRLRRGKSLKAVGTKKKTGRDDYREFDRIRKLKKKKCAHCSRCGGCGL
jgi:hypothetical protein